MSLDAFVSCRCWRCIVTLVAIVVASRAKRALTEMELKTDKAMKFNEFEAIHERFPALFYPAFRLQKSMRDKVRVSVDVFICRDLI